MSDKLGGSMDQEQEIAKVTTRMIRLEPGSLLLDPNNYRFLDLPGYRKVAKRSRYGEGGVQTKALNSLKDNESFDLESLRDSIIENGFVQLDQLVVEEFDKVGGKKRYLVIEGNRRAAAVKTLLDDAKAGSVDLNEDVAKSLEKLPAIVVSGDPEEKEKFHKTLMAIRHVSGIRPWGAYQQAKLVVELYDDEGEQFGQVAKKIGISPVEVGRRYRASKALEQMEKDDEFGGNASPKLYTFFHEAISQPKVRDWLEFSDENYVAENEDARRLFYELLSPREIDGEKKIAKLQNANRQVRQMKFIVESDKALEILGDPEKEFEEAAAVAIEDAESDQSGVTEAALKAALRALRKPGIDAWSEPSDKSKELWEEIMRLFRSIERVIEEDDAEDEE